MSVRIACPACAKPLKIAETLLGKELACPKCEARIVAPPIGSATDPDTRAYTLLCIGCGAVLTIDDQTVETPVQCSTCGTPVEFADYPDLAAFREEVRAEKKAAQKAAREAERAAKEAEKGARLAEQEAARKAEWEKAEAAEAEERRWQAQLEAERQAVERQEAEQAAAALESELWENGLRLNHAGGCIRCGSVRLVQAEVLSDIGKLLVVIGVCSIVSGLICSLNAADKGMKFLGPIGFGGITGGAIMAGVSVWFRCMEHRCRQCGWRWRT